MLSPFIEQIQRSGRVLMHSRLNKKFVDEALVVLKEAKGLDAEGKHLVSQIILSLKTRNVQLKFGLGVGRIAEEMGRLYSLPKGYTHNAPKAMLVSINKIMERNNMALVLESQYRPIGIDSVVDFAGALGNFGLEFKRKDEVITLLNLLQFHDTDLLNEVISCINNSSQKETYFPYAETNLIQLLKKQAKVDEMKMQIEESSIFLDK